MLFKTKTPLGQDGKPLKQSGNAIVGYRKSHQFYYNANDELIKSISITQEGMNLKEVTTTYQYDAFGRRIAKQTQTKEKTKFVNRQTAKIIKFPVQQHKTKQSQVNYLWDGNRQLQEQTDTHVFTTIYEQNSFEPVARLVWLQDGVEIAANEPEYQSVWEDEPDPLKIQVYHYHNDHLGTPNELTSQDGEVVWLADYEAWGNTAKVVWREEQLESVQVTSDELQPIRFQGQSFDEETGLHYNRFRYFDSDLGMFISRDPIGLLGGINTFAYAPNPTGWIDPWGLARKRKGSQTKHNDCCSCKIGNAYRILPDDHDLTDGISAKDPTADYSEEGHVLHASKPSVKTQYISASKTVAQAISNREKYGHPSQKIVKIDLSKVNGSVIDLNSSCSPLKGNTAKNRANASGEILITGHIPSSAITILPF